MKKSDKEAVTAFHHSIPTAKVYVFNNPKVGEEGKPWKVGVLGWGDIMIIHHDALTFEDAWQWLYENYKRETP